MKKSLKPWYFYYLRAAISRIWRWSPARRAALNAATVPGGKKCIKCSEVMKPFKKGRRTYSGVEVDHILPVCDIAKNKITWDEYVTRKLGAELKDLQVLCVKCHKEKSALEQKLRKRAA